jgi:L-ascorbate 6-phosphate lactonase
MGLYVTWLGQSGLLLESGGQTVLIDPWLSPHPLRTLPPPVIGIWPAQIDLVLITHGHGDHLDLPGLASLTGRTRIAEIAAPEPHLASIAEALPGIRRMGVRPNTPLDRLGGIAVLPAWHGVTVADGYGPMIAADGTSPQVGYQFELGGVGVYISGDTIADPALVEAVRPLRTELVFLPVNGHDAEREARGILGNMSADEAVDFALAIGARALVPLHFDGVSGNTSDVGEVERAANGKPLRLILPARSIPWAFNGTPQ